MAMNLDYSDVLKMKKAVDDRFHLNVHFHDGCGGQYFSLDEKPTAELTDYIIKYFSELGIKVNYTDDFQMFTLDKI